MFQKWSSRSKKMNLQKTLCTTIVTVKTLKCEVSTRQHSLLHGVPSTGRRISGRQEVSRDCRASSKEASELVLLELPGHEVAETTLENATAGVLLAGKLVRTACVKTRRTLTRWIDVRVTRRPRETLQSIGLEPAHLDGKMDAQSESTEEEQEEWSLPVVFCQFSNIGAGFIVEVDFVHPKAGEYVTDRLRKETKPTHFARGRSVARCSRSRTQRCEVPT